MVWSVGETASGGAKGMGAGAGAAAVAPKGKDKGLGGDKAAEKPMIGVAGGPNFDDFEDGPDNEEEEEVKAVNLDEQKKPPVPKPRPLPVGGKFGGTAQKEENVGRGGDDDFEDDELGEGEGAEVWVFFSLSLF